MSNVPEREKERNLEFYKRWRVNKEKLQGLLVEYGFSYPRAYQIKKNLEDKYPEELESL